MKKHDRRGSARPCFHNMDQQTINNHMTMTERNLIQGDCHMRRYTYSDDGRVASRSFVPDCDEANGAVTWWEAEYGCAGTVYPGLYLTNPLPEFWGTYLGEAEDWARRAEPF